MEQLVEQLVEHAEVAVIGGGQSGLAAAAELQRHGITPVVLEAGDRPAGSWPHYYDSLHLFSPARFSALRGVPLGGDPDRYPHRDEIADYLQRYASRLDADIRTRTRVLAVQADREGFRLELEGGRALRAAGVVSATGAFSNPRRPDLPGQADFGGEILHAADYRNPGVFAGKRIVVLGGGNTAVQVAHELAAHARVTLASRSPLRFLSQIREGRDVHHWLTASGFDALPPQWLVHYVGGTLVMDDGRYEAALRDGRFDRRPVFASLDTDGVVWGDGTRESVDVLLLATGYRPGAGHLRHLGALDPGGAPLHSGGLSLTHPGLVHLGLEFQRSFASNTLRGVAHDAAHVIPPLVAHVRRAPAATGL